MKSSERLINDFEIYHSKNPNVYDMFKEFTLRAIKRGFVHLSADMVLHRIRWETYIETIDPDPSGFKINNNYAAFYGRLFMRDFPAYAGFFRTRSSVADERQAA